MFEPENEVVESELEREYQVLENRIQKRTQKVLEGYVCNKLVKEFK